MQCTNKCDSRPYTDRDIALHTKPETLKAWLSFLEKAWDSADGSCWIHRNCHHCGINADIFIQVTEAYFDRTYERHIEDCARLAVLSLEAEDVVCAVYIA